MYFFPSRPPTSEREKNIIKTKTTGWRSFFRRRKKPHKSNKSILLVLHCLRGQRESVEWHPVHFLSLLLYTSTKKRRLFFVFFLSARKKYIYPFVEMPIENMATRISISASRGKKEDARRVTWQLGQGWKKQKDVSKKKSETSTGSVRRIWRNITRISRKLWNFRIESNTLIYVFQRWDM